MSIAATGQPGVGGMQSPNSLTAGKGSSGTKLANEEMGMGKEAFLQLLIAQIKHQDPLKPVEDRELIAQLTQFSNLEQAMEGNKKLDSLIAQNKQQQVTGLVSWIDKTVVVDKNTIDIDTHEGIEKFWIETPPGHGSLGIEIRNDKGELVRSIPSKQTQAGLHAFEWDKKDESGSAVSPGRFYIQGDYRAEDGSVAPVKVISQGRVVSALIDENKVQVGDALYSLEDIHQVK